MAKAQALTVGKELASVVRQARARVYWCQRHRQSQTPYCQDCIVESVFQMQIRSLADILNPAL